jgi:TRAP-type mannitol/chloroaromatic compound transport system substrate-binding protein
MKRREVLNTAAVAIASVADLKGLKMRIPGWGGEVMSRLRVNVQVLPVGTLGDI